MKCFAEDAAFPFRNRRADFVFAGVLLASALALILGCVLFSRSHSLEALFVYLLCGVLNVVHIYRDSSGDSVRDDGRSSA